MQRHLLHAQKLESLGVLAGGIAHDFNNLLVGILTNAQFAGTTAWNRGTPPTRRSMTSYAAAKRAAGLTRQLLAYSGRAPAVSRPTQLARACEGNHPPARVEYLQGRSPPPRLARRFACVDTDVAQFQQVIMNVILNGAESIGARGGDVHVKAGVTELAGGDLGRLVSLSAREGPHVMIEIARHGARHRRRCARTDLRSVLYDERTRTRARARSRDRHHARPPGRARVTSTPGRGTTVRLFFPVAANEPAEATSAPDGSRPRTRHRSGHRRREDGPRRTRAAFWRVAATMHLSRIVAAKGWRFSRRAWQVFAVSSST